MTFQIRQMPLTGLIVRVPVSTCDNEMYVQFCTCMRVCLLQWRMCECVNFVLNKHIYE